MVIIGTCVGLIVIALLVGTFNNTEHFASVPVPTVPPPTVVPKPTVSSAAIPTANPENVNIADAMEKLIQKFGITSISEVGCGNCVWVPILLGKIPTLKYTGYEKSPVLVEQAKATLSKFKTATVQVADPTTAIPVVSDLVVSRNLLQTLSYVGIRQTLINFSKFNCKFIALGNYGHDSSDNKNVKTGETFLINLEKEPFNMSPADIKMEGTTNRLFYVYTLDQMQGYITGNTFWKNPGKI
jgi:hypothetical protein